MTRGSKKAYTSKQKRQARSIDGGAKKRSSSKRSTDVGYVTSKNGGKKTSSVRSKTRSSVASRVGGRKGGRKVSSARKSR